MTTEQKEQWITDVTGLITLSSIRLSDDMADALHKLYAAETDETAKTMYGSIEENLALAKKLHRPICQDTGLLHFFLDVGTGFPYMDDIEEVLTSATRRATKETPLRPNAVSPVGEKNSGDNTGYGAPYIDYNLVPLRSDLRLRFYLTGGGCSLPGRSKVLMPLEGVNGIKKYLYDTVVEWGVNACPPLTVGVGIGADAANAAKLSKKALIRNIGSRNPDPVFAAMEEEMQRDLDAIGIAPLGFGGSRSVLCVHVEAAARHPATLGVGLSFGCWATRRGEMIVRPDLSCEILSHTNNTEASAQ